jgi:outer membrane protein assembly factor BamB
VKCGKGYSGPVVSKGIVVLMERRKEAPDNEWTRALDAKTGREIWKMSVPCRWTAPRGDSWGPASTPATSQGKVLCLGIEGRLRCHELSSGRLVWEKDLANDYQVTGEENENYGFVTSPLAVGDLGLLQVCARSSGVGLVAWHLPDGKEAWRTPHFPNYCSSPGFFQGGDVPLVLACATNKTAALKGGDLFGFDGRTGELLWSLHTGKTYYNCPTPTAGNGMVVLEGGGGDGPTVGVKLASPVNRAPTVAWSVPNHLVRFSSYLSYRGLVFGHGYPAHGGRHLLFCIDPNDGSVLWDAKDKDIHQWLLGSDGKVLALRETGELILFDADARNGYRILARAQVVDKTWAHPALVDGRLYIRTDTQLVCLDLSAK